MNEEYIQEIPGQEVLSDPEQTSAPGADPDLFLSSGDASSPSPEDVPESDEVFSDDQGTFFSVVSGGDLDGIYSRLEATEAELISLQETLADANLLLEKIDYKLGAILALLVFFFCFKRIRSGAKTFTGRGLDE